MKRKKFVVGKKNIRRVGEIEKKLVMIDNLGWDSKTVKRNDKEGGRG
jgi:hypothetical protein